MTQPGPSIHEPELTLAESLANAWRFLSLLRPFWWSLGKGLLIGIAISFVGLASPYFTKLFVDEIYPAQNLILMQVVVGLVAAITLAVAVAGAIRNYFGTAVAVQVGAAVGLLFANHMQHKRTRFYDQRRIGEIMGRYGELQRAVGVVTGSMPQTALNALYLVIVPPILCMLHWRLALVALSGFPLRLVVLLISSKALRRRWQRTAEAHAELNGIQVEVLTNVRALRTSGAEPWCYQRIAALQRQTITAELQAAAMSNRVAVSTTIIDAVATALFTWYAWTLVLSQELSLGALMAFTAYLTFFARPSAQLSGIFSSMQQTAVSLSRIFEYLDAPVEQDPENAASGTRAPHKRIRGDVDFRGVSFGYTTERPVLTRVSCRFQQGSVNAVLGVSGAGKSSLLRLICRLYDADEGSIVVDGKPIESYDLRDLREEIAVVSQAAGLIQGTIWDNIVLGRSDLSDAAVRRAVQICQLEEFVANLPRGLATPLAECGATLSAGQQQRLAIARAVVRAAPILLLDEATSNLDLATESALLDALFEAQRGSTIVMATHRVYTARRADQILMIKDACLTICGQHEAVLGDVAVEVAPRQSGATGAGARFGSTTLW